MFTVRTGVFQIRHMNWWLDATILQLFHRNKNHVARCDDKHSISQFQSMCTALAATIGTGNIAGVATAITAGGPGAVFWMWLSAFLGMMTNFAENVLGIKYRYKNENGDWIGGAFVYIEKGLGKSWRWMAVLFACFCALASFGIGNMTQVNSIADGLENSFQIDPQITAIILMVFAFSTVLGWSYYGERAVEYLFGLKAVMPYKIMYICVVYLGCTTSLNLVWNIADVNNRLDKSGLMMHGGTIVDASLIAAPKSTKSPRLSSG